MSVLYIHIGTPKTGTTAIQKYLCANRAQIEKQGFIYPDFKKKYPYAELSRNGCFLEKRSYDEEEYKRCMGLIIDSFQKFPNVILSDEGIWNNGAANEVTWERLLEYTKPADIQVKIIVYLRRQDDYIFSHWSQKIKDQKLTESFREYCREASYKKEHMDYLKMLDFIGGYVGEENIIVRPYERKQFVEESIIPDFLNVVGIQATKDFKERKGADNISYKDSIIELKRRLNMCPTYLEKMGKSNLRSYISRLQKQLQKEGRLKDRKELTPNLRKEILSLFEKGNQEIARKYLKREDGVLLYDMAVDKAVEAFTFAEEEIKYNFNKLLRMLEHEDDIAFTIEDLKNLYSEMFHESIPYEYGEELEKAQGKKKKAVSFTDRVKRKVKKIFSRRNG